MLKKKPIKVEHVIYGQCRYHAFHSTCLTGLSTPDNFVANCQDRCPDPPRDKKVEEINVTITISPLKRMRQSTDAETRETKRKMPF